MHDRPNGFTLVEVVIAMFVIAVGVIATAPLFVTASQENASGGDLGEAGAIAVRTMERLRQTSYFDLIPGGDLESDVNGYFDASDPDFIVRWTVATNANPAGTKVIVVRVQAARQVFGLPKQVFMRSMRGQA